MSKFTKMELIGSYCRGFRTTTLNKTLDQVANGTSIKTLSGFESGRSSNLLHIYKYMDQCRTREERNFFLRGLVEILEEVSVYG